MKLTKKQLKTIIQEELEDLEQVDENWQAQQAESQCRLVNSYGFTPDDEGWPGGLSYATCEEILGDMMTPALASWGEERLAQAPERRAKRPRAAPRLPSLKSLAESLPPTFSKHDLHTIIKEELDVFLQEDEDDDFEVQDELTGLGQYRTNTERLDKPTLTVFDLLSDGSKSQTWWHPSRRGDGAEISSTTGQWGVGELKYEDGEYILRSPGRQRQSFRWVEDRSSDPQEIADILEIVVDPERETGFGAAVKRHKSERERREANKAAMQASFAPSED